MAGVSRKRRIASTLLALTVVLAFSWLGWFTFETIKFYTGPSEKLLSETGIDLVAAASGTMNSTYRFEPMHPFWSDGAAKERYIYLPPGKQIDNSNADRWNFPIGTRLWKKFERDGVQVEVRMLFKHGDQPEDWDMSAYYWLADKSDAKKIMLGKSDVFETNHNIPSPSKCVTCHSSDENRRPLGLTAIQLPWSHDSNLSLSQLIREGWLTDPPDRPYKIPGNDLTRSALGYLDTNCGSCHYDGSTFVPEEVSLFLNLTTTSLASVEASNAFQTAINGTPDIKGLGTEVYLKPGSPEDSFMHRRMTIRDNGGWQMPPLATEVVDELGAALIADWIRSLSVSNQATGHSR